MPGRPHLLSALFFAFILGASALLPTRSSATDAGPITAEPCGIFPTAIVFLDSDTAPTQFAAYLQSTHDREGPISGTLRISASGHSYRVAFTNVRVFTKPYSARQRDPIFFSLPAGSAIESAFVERATLTDGRNRICTIEGPWTPASNSIFDDAVAPFIIDQHPHGDPLSTIAVPDDEHCIAPSSAANTRFAALPHGYPLIRTAGIVTVVLRLDRASNIESVLIQASTSTDLNADALDTARRSVFVTRFVDCRPIALTSLFRVEYRTK